MTAIAAVIHNGQVHMMADSAACSQQLLVTRKVPKAMERKGQDGAVWTFGVAGLAAITQTFEYILELPKLPPDCSDIRKFVVVELLSHLREALTKENLLEKKDGVNRMDATVLVGLQGHLFCIDEVLYVRESIYDFETVGSGRDEAWGVLFATPNLPPEERLMLALEAAEAHTPSVRRPFGIHTIP